MSCLKLLISFGYLILAVSCSDNLPVREVLNSTVQTISFDTVNIKASEIGLSIRYIPLKTGDKPNLIGDYPERVIVSGNKIFLLDQKISNSLYVFDTSGNFLYKKPSSPTESLLPGYSNKEYSLTDFAIDESSNSLLLYISNLGAVLNFDMNSGAYKKSVKLNPHLILNKLNVSNDGSFIFSNTYANLGSSKKYIHLVKYDSLGNFKEGWLRDPLSSLNKRYNGLCLTSSSSNFNELLFARFGGDTIYALQGDSLTTRYKMELSNFSIPASFQTHLKLHDASVNLNPETSEELGIFTTIHSTSKYIAFQIVSPTGLVLPCWYNKDTRKGGVITSFNNDLSPYPIQPFPDYMDNVVYASFISSTTINNINRIYAQGAAVNQSKTLFPGHDPIMSLLYFKK